jgi:hypothetical protein
LWYHSLYSFSLPGSGLEPTTSMYRLSLIAFSFGHAFFC